MGEKEYKCMECNRYGLLRNIANGSVKDYCYFGNRGLTNDEMKLTRNKEEQEGYCPAFKYIYHHYTGGEMYG